MTGRSGPSESTDPMRRGCNKRMTASTMQPEATEANKSLPPDQEGVAQQTTARTPGQAQRTRGGVRVVRAAAQGDCRSQVHARGVRAQGIDHRAYVQHPLDQRRRWLMGPGAMVAQGAIKVDSARLVEAVRSDNDVALAIEHDDAAQLHLATRRYWRVRRLLDLP